MFAYYEWLLLLFPLAGALLNALLGARLARRVQGWIACGAIAAAIVVTLPMLIGAGMAPGLVGRPKAFTWYQVWAGSRFVEAPWALRIDALSTLCAATVLLVAWFVHVHAARHTPDGPSRPYLLARLNGVTFALLASLAAEDLLFLALGWALSGWLLRMPPSGDETGGPRSGARRCALALHLLADLSLLTAWALASVTWSSTSLLDLTSLAPEWGLSVVPPAQVAAFGALLCASILLRASLFLLDPDPQAGSPHPPLAALTATAAALPGLYLVARMAALIAATPVLPALLAWVGATLALLSALWGVVAPASPPAGRLLYRSHVGLSFLALGVGAPAVSMAFLPASIVLGALVELSAPALPDQGEPSRAAPWLAAVALVGLAGLAPLPGLSYYAQITAATASVGLAPYVVLLAALLVAGAAGRALRGAWRDRTRCGRPAPAAWGALGGLALYGGIALLSPSPLATFLAPLFGEPSPPPGWAWLTMAAGIPLLGIAAGWLIVPPARPSTSPALSQLDRGCERLLLRPTAQLTAAIARAERQVAALIERALALRGREDPPTGAALSLSVLTFVLGTAIILAYLVLAK
ncbi:MAG: hypothetical protein JXA09_17565 [Anaerolineae bacterium]|nr:hypothetical protein [Anaerolineae bacterium]